MCNNNVFESNSNKEGVFSVIKAKSFERAQTFVSKHAKEKAENIFKSLGRIKRLIEEDQNDDPQAIKVTVCKDGVCITVEFWKSIDVDITIEIKDEDEDDEEGTKK